MSCEYRQLGDVAIQFIDGDRGKNYPSNNEFSNVGYCLFLNAKNVTPDGFSFGEVSFITQKKDAMLRKGKLEKNDVVLTTRGTVGNVAFYGARVLYSNVRINSGMLIIRPDPSVFCPEYVYWLFRSDVIQDQIKRFRSGTAQPQLPISSIKKFEIPLVDIKTQKKIAAILSALDEKIAINRAINDNLEQQAFALFDSLFPRTIDGSQTIGDYINPKRGRNLLSKDAVYGTVPVVAGGLEPSTYHNVANTKAPVLTISASGANAGFVNLWLNPVWSSDSSYIDSSMTPNVFFWYILLKGRQKEIFDAQTGSAQPHIYPQHIAAMPIGNLNQESVSQFTTQVAPLFELIGANKDENERLRNIRDALLPRLMSGEIDVTDICI